VINPISRFWDTKQMSRTISSGDHGSVVTGSRVVDDYPPLASLLRRLGELFSEANDLSASLLLSYGTTHILVTGHDEARGVVLGRQPLHEALNGHQRLETTHTLSQGSAHYC
jgi:hypothetical protein